MEAVTVELGLWSEHPGKGVWIISSPQWFSYSIQWFLVPRDKISYHSALADCEEQFYGSFLSSDASNKCAGDSFTVDVRSVKDLIASKENGRIEL